MYVDDTVPVDSDDSRVYLFHESGQYDEINQVFLENTQNAVGQLFIARELVPVYVDGRDPAFAGNSESTRIGLVAEDNRDLSARNLSRSDRIKYRLEIRTLPGSED